VIVLEKEGFYFYNSGQSQTMMPTTPIPQESITTSQHTPSESFTAPLSHTSQSIIDKLPSSFISDTQKTTPFLQNEIASNIPMIIDDDTQINSSNTTATETTQIGSSTTDSSITNEIVNNEDSNNYYSPQQRDSSKFTMVKGPNKEIIKIRFKDNMIDFNDILTVVKTHMHSTAKSNWLRSEANQTSKLYDKKPEDYLVIQKGGGSGLSSRGTWVHPFFLKKILKSTESMSNSTLEVKASISWILNAIDQIYYKGGPHDTPALIYNKYVTRNWEYGSKNAEKKRKTSDSDSMTTIRSNKVNRNNDSNSQIIPQSTESTGTKSFDNVVHNETDNNEYSTEEEREYNFDRKEKNENTRVAFRIQQPPNQLLPPNKKPIKDKLSEMAEIIKQMKGMKEYFESPNRSQHINNNREENNVNEESQPQKDMIHMFDKAIYGATKTYMTVALSALGEYCNT
jgi:hypothetical protein